MHSVQIHSEAADIYQVSIGSLIGEYMHYEYIYIWNLECEIWWVSCWTNYWLNLIERERMSELCLACSVMASQISGTKCSFLGKWEARLTVGYSFYICISQSPFNLSSMWGCWSLSNLFTLHTSFRYIKVTHQVLNVVSYLVIFIAMADSLKPINMDYISENGGGGLGIC